jgi:hypothetical protein
MKVKILWDSWKKSDHLEFWEGEKYSVSIKPMGQHFKNGPFKCQKQGMWRWAHLSRQTMNSWLKLNNGKWQVGGCG